MEQELHRAETVLVRSTLSSKLGTAILTDERVLFWDTRSGDADAEGLEGVIAGWITDRLQERHAAKGPFLELPLTAITRITRESKLMSKDRIRIFTADRQEHLFNEGWRVWGHYLVEVLRSRYGRRAVPVSADEWRFEEPART